MLIIVLAICAATAVLTIDLIAKLMTKPSVPVKQESRPEWCRYDYLGELRNRKLSSEEVAHLEDIADRACERGLGMVDRLNQPLTPEDFAHINKCAFCQSVICIAGIDLPPI